MVFPMVFVWGDNRDNTGIMMDIPSGKLTLFWKMVIEIVSFPSNSMVNFHSYVKSPEGTQHNLPTSL